MDELNIIKFNEILLQYVNDDKKKLNILEDEMCMAADVFYDETAILLDELAEKGYESKQFQKIKNIRNNIEYFLKRIDELERKLKINGYEDGGDSE